MAIPLRLGLDFSNDPPGSAAIRATGRDFVIRYAARDWRGLKRYELADYRANGIDVAMVYESTEGRVREGYVAGAFDATYAHNFLAEMGLPNTMPIYFAVDFDIGEGDHAAFLQYLQGADDAIGAPRVGVYGGLNAITYAADTGVLWLWQTISWSGGFVNYHLHPKALLFQNRFNHWVSGTNCDDNDAYAKNFGQFSLFEDQEQSTPLPPPPLFPAPDLPDFYDRVNGQRHPSAFRYKGRMYYPVRQRIRAIAETRMLTKPNNRAAKAGANLPAGALIEVDWLTSDAAGHTYPLNGDGYYRGSRFEPQLFLPEKRGEPISIVHTEVQQ